MAAAQRPKRERSAAPAALRSSRRGRGGPALPLRGEGLVAALDRLTPLLVHGLVILLLVAVGAAHSAAPPDLEFSAFYLLPIGVAAWTLGRGAAAAWAVVAAGEWLVVVHQSAAGTPELALWSAFILLAVFLMVALSVGGVRSLLDRLRAFAGTDPLTGVLNAASFEELVELERSRALRYNRPFTLAYLDVDGFRVVNEVRGHSTGDRALELLAQTARENLRSMDSVARLGGDEFGILLPETGRGAADVALEKVRTCLDEAVTARGLPLTFSMGAVICVGAPESVDRLIQRADTLMYQVKEQGGNGIAIDVLDDPFGIEAILQRG